VDSAVDKNANNQPVKLWPCHNQGGNQVLQTTPFLKKSDPFVHSDSLEFICAIQITRMYVCMYVA